MQQDQQVSWTLWKNAMALTQQVLPTALWSQFKSVRLVDSLIQLAICTGLKMLNPPLSASLGPFGTQATSSTCQTKASTKKDKKRTKKRLILNPLNPLHWIQGSAAHASDWSPHAPWRALPKLDLQHEPAESNMASLVFLNCQSTVLPFQAWRITINTTLFQAWLDHGFKLGRKMWAHHAPENQVLYVMSSLWNPLTLKCWNLRTSIVMVSERNKQIELTRFIPYSQSYEQHRTTSQGVSGINGPSS